MKTAAAISDPRKLFVRLGRSATNVTRIDGVSAGGHRPGGETCLDVSWIDSINPTSVTGEDADVFAIDFYRLTGVDLYETIGLEKPSWVALEMAPPVLKPSRPVLFTDGDDPLYLETSLGLRVGPLRKRLAPARLKGGA